MFDIRHEKVIKTMKQNDLVWHTIVIKNSRWYIFILAEKFENIQICWSWYFCCETLLWWHNLWSYLIHIFKLFMSIYCLCNLELIISLFNKGYCQFFTIAFITSQKEWRVSKWLCKTWVKILLNCDEWKGRVRIISEIFSMML